MMNKIMEMSFNSQDPALFMSAYLHLLVCLHTEMRCGCTDGNRRVCVYRTDA